MPFCFRGPDRKKAETCRIAVNARPFTMSEGVDIGSPCLWEFERDGVLSFKPPRAHHIPKGCEVVTMCLLCPHLVKKEEQMTIILQAFEGTPIYILYALHTQMFMRLAPPAFWSFFF